jgi:hypothetical protein
MKQFKIANITSAVALLLGAGSASADIVVDGAGTPVKVDQGGSTQTTWVGSDTLNKVITTVLPSIPGGLLQLNATTGYLDQGSGQGQRQLEGSPRASTSEPACTVGGASDANGYNETNPGCQEISPMSRLMDAAICEDDITDPGGDNTAVKNTSAEHLAVCGDAIVVITDNAAHRAYADVDAGSCPAAGASSDNGSPFTPSAAYAKAGKLRRSGSFPVEFGGSGTYSVGAGGTGWKDVLRLVYTGCKNTDGTCGTVSRQARCSDPVRKTLLNRWDILVESGALADSVDAASVAACAGTNPCPSLANGDGGLRQAYRRDDGSGTTGAFLGFLGLAATSLLQRSALIQLVGISTQVVPIPDLALTGTTVTGNIFCDGGDVEGFWTNGIDTTIPYPLPAAAADAEPQNYGDPITRPCKNEDNLCAFHGRVGVVRPIRSPGLGDATFPDYPTKQCSSGRFALKDFVGTNTSIPICPDGSRPAGKQCKLPFYTPDGGVTKDFRCMNNKDNKPGTLPGWVDGRSYNYVVRDVDGNVKALDGAAKRKPDVAQWRQQMAALDNTIPYFAGEIGSTTATSYKCNLVNATALIGCIVGNTTCTIGFAGREAADSSIADDKQEPFRISNALDGTTPAVASCLDGGPPCVTYYNPQDSFVDLLDNSGAPLAAGRAEFPLARDLYLASIGGFENILADCQARTPGADFDFCADEVKIAEEFYNNTELVKTACETAGFLRKNTDPSMGAADTRCIGALAATTCGAPASQPITACDPTP